MEYGIGGLTTKSTGSTGDPQSKVSLLQDGHTMAATGITVASPIDTKKAMAGRGMSTTTGSRMARPFLLHPKGLTSKRNADTFTKERALDSVPHSPR